MAAIGWFFFRHFFFILDVFVVTVSLALELVAVASAHMGLVVGNILIIARMWRFFRVAHGIYFLDHRSDHRSEAVHVTMSKNGGKRDGAPFAPLTCLLSCPKLIAKNVR
jgi:hypothetical protein